MLDYSTALELKKAGFPQGGDGVFHRALCPHYNGVVEFADRCLSEECRETKPVYITTLSELIEACGEEFRFLSKDFFGWVAVSNKEAENPEAHMHVKQICQTPEEAVARLWLALQKK